MQFQFWHVKYFSMFQSPIFGNSSLAFSVLATATVGILDQSEASSEVTWSLLANHRILKWQMLVLLYFVGPSSDWIWIDMQRHSVRDKFWKWILYKRTKILLNENAQKNVFKKYFCDSASLKFQEIQNNSFSTDILFA